MTGTSTQEVDQVKLTMDAQLGSWVPILDEHVCGSNIECPVQATSEWNLNYAFSVDNRLPDGELYTRWKLVGNSGNDAIICADIQLNVD